MLITTACPACAVPLTISSHANGKIISCINCGHNFMVDLRADLAPVVPQVDNSSQSDWPDQPPPIGCQRSRDQRVVMPSDQEWGRESDVNEFGEVGYSLSQGIKENVVRYRRRDRKRVTLAVLGMLFSLVSLACLWAWLLTHLLPWIYGCAASGYVGVHLSLFGKGPIKIVGVILNIAVMVGCFVSVVLLKGLIRIELGW